MSTHAPQPRPQLTPPVADRDHVQGSRHAKVTLVEYGDYQCPFCLEAYPIVKQLQETVGDRMRFAFRNFPLTNAHPNAQHAAEAAESAASQGKFWEMHDYLYEHQARLEDADLIAYAHKLHLDPARFTRDLESHAFAPKVREDFLSGVKSGVNGTPSFFINGFRHDGPWDFEALTAAVVNAAD